MLPFPRHHQRSSSLPLYLIFFLNHVYSCINHPIITSRSEVCHGLQPGKVYHYNYNTLMLLNNHDHKGKEPVGFGFDAGFDIENVWQNATTFLLKVTYAHNAGRFLTRSQESSDSHKKSADVTDVHPLFALIQEIDRLPSSSTDQNEKQQQILSFFTHSGEEASRANIKKSIISLTRSRADPRDHHVTWGSKGDNKITKSFKWANSGSGRAASILNPEIENVWQQEAQLDADHSIISSSTGWQNITLRSRVYNEAHSRMNMVYSLTLENNVKESKSKQSALMRECKTLDQVIDLLGEDLIEESGSFLLHHEKTVCHDCRSMQSLTQEYEDYLRGEESASMQAVIAYLKILNAIRFEGAGVSKDDILSILNKYDKGKHYDIVASLLDILAGARTEASITAALEYLDLQHNDNLDVSERFLSVLPASYVTAANSLLHDWSPAQGVRGKSFFDVTSHRFVMQEIIRILKRDGEWKSEKLRWSCFLSLAAISKSHNKLLLLKKSMLAESGQDRDLSQTVIQMIIHELDSCPDDDCNIAMIHALGNTGNLIDSIDVLERFALNTKGRRETIAAMKSIKECLEQGNPLNDTLVTRLRNLSLKIVYDSKHETTSRIIACEIIAKHLSDPVSSERLLQFISDFGNNEMVTLMWKRALMLAARDTSLNQNWYAHSTLFNGTSSAFTRSMGGTDTMNATYGVSMELLSGGSMLKESSFDFLLGDLKDQQHIVSVGLFTRGLNSFAGGGSEDDDDEVVRGGIALKIMGMSLRPYNMFVGKGSLLGHIWSATASTPLTVYRGNLLLSHHEDSMPMINGFILDQKLRGVVSVDLSGSIDVSIFYRNSNSKVSSKVAALMQGSQSIGSGDPRTSASQLFAFGGATAINTLTDVNFAGDPKMCVKMLHPEEFVLRHNSRKYEQVDSDAAKHRIHKRNYKVNAQSYGLHPKIQEVCEP